MNRKKKIEYCVSIELPVGDSEGHPCFDSREKAQAWCDDWNRQFTEEEKLEDNGRFFATVFEINV